MIFNGVRACMCIGKQHYYTSMFIFLIRTFQAIGVSYR